MAKNELNDLYIILAHELSVAIEMSYDPIEIRELWGDAIDALKRVRIMLINKNLAVPAAVENVIRLAESDTSPI